MEMFGAEVSFQLIDLELVPALRCLYRRCSVSYGTHIEHCYVFAVALQLWTLLL
jgi:hypothetical protein